MTFEGGIYVMWARNGDCLYVGRSLNVPERLQTHSWQKPWWAEVARIDCYPHRYREDLDRDERSIIELYAPRWNVVHRPPEAETLNLVAAGYSVDGSQFGHDYEMPLMTDAGVLIPD